MPVTAHTVWHRAPARAWTRESPERMAVTLRPAASTVGCAIRSKTGFARTRPWPACNVQTGGRPAELERQTADHGHSCPDETDGQFICETVSSSEPEVLRQGRDDRPLGAIAGVCRCNCLAFLLASTSG